MKKVTDKLSISAQIDADDIARAAQDGFTLIINNRPDGEEAGQPTAAENRAAAQKHGMSYVYIPVVPGQISEKQVREFQAAVASAKGPVLAHCRTGTRALQLWTIGEALDGRISGEEVMELGARLGIDLSGAKKWLDAHS